MIADRASVLQPALALVLAACATLSMRDPAPTSVVADAIEIHGNTHTRDKVIRRALGLALPARVDAEVLARATRRLVALGYFLAVDIEARPSAIFGLATVYVEVVERPARFVVTSGFSSAENFFAECTMRQTPSGATAASAAPAARPASP